jgi:POT family proton-dependent oligopeptide transporter
MALGLAQFLFGRSSLGAAGSPPASTSTPPRTFWTRLGIVGVAVLGLGALAASSMPELSTVERIFDLLLPALSAAVLALLFAKGAESAAERRRLAMIVLLFVSSAIFWGCFEQAGSTLTLFASRHTERNVFGWEFGATAYQALNSLFVIGLAPLFARLWSGLAASGREPSTPVKFGLAMILAGIGFLILVPVSSGPPESVRVGPQWLVFVYFALTCGELCLSPVGLSAMTRLAPPRTGGLIMGVWFLSASLGNYMAGRAVALTGTLSMDRTFLLTALVPAAVGVLLFLSAPSLRRMLERP